MTVRKAIDELVSIGWLYRIQGKGSFVSSLEINKSYGVVGFTENMIQQGYLPSNKVLRFEITQPDNDELIKALKLFPKDDVYIIKRLRLVDEEPLALETVFLLVKAFPGLLKYDFEKESLYEVLKNKYNAQPIFSRQKLNAVTVDGEEARILFAKKSGVALKMRNTTYGVDMKPIEFAESIYHGKYTFNFVLKKK